MAEWIYHLDLRDLWKDRDNNSKSISEIGKEVAKRVRNLPCFETYRDELEEIADDFEFVEEDERAFDYILSYLYDWADSPLPAPTRQMQRKLCWIKTIF